MHLNVHRIQNVMDRSRRHHQTGIHRSTDDTSERIPGSFVEPIQKRIESIFYHIMRGSIVEPKTTEILPQASQILKKTLTKDRIRE